MSVNGSTARKQLKRINKFFLRVGRNKEGLLEIATYNAKTKQTVKLLCTGTSDLQQAELDLAAYATKHSAEKCAPDMRLSKVMTTYYLLHSQYLPTAGNTKLTMRYTMEVWGDPMASELTALKQRAFVDHMRAQIYTVDPRKPRKDGKPHALPFAKLGKRRFSDAMILKVQKCVWTALKFCNTENLLSSYPPRVRGNQWKPAVVLNKRKAIYTIPQLAKLFDAAASAPTDNGWRFLLLSLGTGGRPTAVLTMRREQITFDPDLIALNPEGRPQNKKRRPTVPMCPTVADWARDWGPGRIVLNRYGRPIAVSKDGRASLKVYNAISARAGVPGYPYKLRYTIGTWLAAETSDKAKWERGCFMGHRGTDTTSSDEDYELYNPAFMRECADAIERLFREIDKYTTVRKIIKGANLPRSLPATTSLLAQLTFTGPESVKIAAPSFGWGTAPWQNRDMNLGNLLDPQWLPVQGRYPDKAD